MTDDVESFKRKIEQLFQSGGPEIVLPLQQIQEMKTNDLYLLERSMHYEGKPIEIRSIINIQKELKRRTGRISALSAVYPKGLSRWVRVHLH